MAAIAFELPEEIRAVRDGLDAFLKAEVVARHARHHDLLADPRRTYDEDGRYRPEVVALIREVRMAAAEAGYYNMCVPEALDGAGLGLLAYYACWQHAFHSCGAHNWLAVYAISHWAFGPSRILENVTDAARAEILDGMLAGRTSMCFGLSEPGAGSDAAMRQTRATADGDGWRITGRKIWTTNSPIADYCIVFAVTEPERAAARKGGISAFLVPTDAEGFTLESIIRMHGSVGGNEAQLVFDQVRVEPWQLVGELHQGFRTAIQGVSLGRIYNSARAVAQSQIHIPAQQAMDDGAAQDLVGAIGDVDRAHHVVGLGQAELVGEAHGPMGSGSPGRSPVR